MLTRLLKTLLSKERSVHVMALSFGMGVYIAFSPFIGFHTIMTVLFAWLFSLNFFVVFVASHLINNPWTMIPVYGGGYVVGKWILVGLFGEAAAASNPFFMDFFNRWLTSLFGLEQVSFWAFMLGGNMLGIIGGVASYFVIKKLAAYTLEKKDSDGLGAE